MPRYTLVDSKPSSSEFSEFSGPISSKRHSNPNIEAEFCNLYAIILQKLCENFQTGYGYFCKALYSIKTHREPNKPPRLPVYDRNDSRFAYLFSFSIIHSVVMYDRFRDMMKNNPSMLKKIFSMSELNICLLGGGPAFEAAAICKFLKKSLAIFKPDTSSQLLIRLKVIDKCAEWKTVIKCLFTTLQKELHPQIEVDFCFIQADLTEEMSPAVIAAIESSYIVSMFKFVSEVFDRYGPEKVEKMIKGILDVMSFESCLFFLDNAGGEMFSNSEEIIRKIPCTSRFYGQLYHCQELTADTIEEYSFFVKDIVQTLKCTSMTTISCSAWLKINRMKQNIDSFPILENKYLKKNKEKKLKSCEEEGNVEQDINSSIPKSAVVKNNEKKKEGENSCKEESGAEQDINGLIQKGMDTKSNQKKQEEELKNSCKEESGIEQDINSSIQKSTDVTNNQKKVKGCKEKGNGGQDINSSIKILSDIKKKQKKEKKVVKGIRCMSLNQKLENVESRFSILKR